MLELVKQDKHQPRFMQHCNNNVNGYNITSYKTIKTKEY